jgi:hypothetical protein
MPRNTRAQMLMPVALSIQAAADACMCRPEEIRDTIEKGGVPVFQLGMRKRVLVPHLIDAIVKVWPHAQIEKRLSHAKAATNPAADAKRPHRVRKGTLGSGAASPHPQAAVRTN